MVINLIETAWVSLPLPKPRGLATGLITHSTDAICRISTVGGLEGIGESRGGPLNEICEIIDTLLKPKLLGQHAAETERLYHLIYDTLLGPAAPKYPWSTRTLLSAIAAVDLALWDIRAQAAGISMCRLFGCKMHAVPAYVSDGYYVEGQNHAEMAEECLVALASGGFTRLKIRIGKDPDDDIARLRAVRQAVGDGVDLMADVNEAWDFEQAKAMLPRLEEFNLFWLEDPLKLDRPPEDPFRPERQLGELARMTKIPLAAGENHITYEECYALLDNAPIKYMQFDATKNGGVSEYTKVAEACLQHDVRMAPHHALHFHAHLVGSMPQGFIVESFNYAKQHPAWPNLFIGFPQVRDGKVPLPDLPGWGMQINEEFLSREGVKMAWRM